MSDPPARAGPFGCVYMEDFQPSQVRSRVTNGEMSHLRGLALYPYKHRKFYKRDDQRSRVSPKRASPSRRAGSPPHIHPLVGLNSVVLVDLVI